MSLVGTIFAPFPPETWTNLLHPRPFQSLNGSGGVVSVFARSFVVLGARAGCTDSRVHGTHRAVVC